MKPFKDMTDRELEVLLADNRKAYDTFKEKGNPSAEVYEGVIKEIIEEIKNRGGLEAKRKRKK
jgi:hypothetical protein